MKNWVQGRDSSASVSKRVAYPHNNAIDPSGDVAVFRTLFIAPESDEPEVRTRIQSALRSSDHWLVRFSRPRPLQLAERALATQLASTAVVGRG